MLYLHSFSLNRVITLIILLYRFFHKLSLFTIYKFVLIQLYFVFFFLSTYLPSLRTYLVPILMCLFFLYLIVFSFPLVVFFSFSFFDFLIRLYPQFPHSFYCFYFSSFSFISISFFCLKLCRSVLCCSVVCRSVLCRSVLCRSGLCRSV